MTTQDKLGFTLFLLGSGLLLFLGVISSGNVSYHLPQVLGQALGFALGALLILSLTPYRKRISLAVVIGTALLLSSGKFTYEQYEIYSEEKALARNMIGLADALTDHKQIAMRGGTPKSLSLSDVVQNYFSRMQRIQSEYIAAVERAQLGDMLAPENLVDPGVARQSMRRLTSLQRALPEFEDRTIREIDLLEKTLSGRKDGQSVAFLNGFRKTKGDGIHLVRAYFKNQQEISSVVEEILRSAIDVKGEIVSRNGQLLFSDEGQVDKYNGYLERLRQLTQEEERIQELQVREFGSRMDKLRNSYAH